CVVDTLSEHCLRPRLSQLCSGCVPGCQYLLGLLGGGVCAGTRGNAGGDRGAAQLGEHVLEGGLGLGCVPGLVVAAGGEGVPGWPCRAYQVTTRVETIRANGTVRSTARRVRLRSSPAPGMLRAPAKACSMDHRAA